MSKASDNIEINDTFRDSPNEEFWKKVAMVLEDNNWELTLLPEVHGFRVDNNWVEKSGVEDLRTFPEFHHTFENVDRSTQGAIVSMLADFFASSVLSEERRIAIRDTVEKVAKTNAERIAAEDKAKNISDDVSAVYRDVASASINLDCLLACTSFSHPASVFDAIRERGLQAEHDKQIADREAYKNQRDRVQDFFL